MNKRSIIIGICVIAITVCALSFAKTGGFGTGTSAQGNGNPNPVAQVGSNRSLTTVSLNKQKQVEGQPAPQGDGEIPDYVTHGYLFRSVIMFRQKAAEEEQQGRLGVGYTKAIQQTLKLTDEVSKALEDAVTAWESKNEGIVARVDGIIAGYQAEKSRALSVGKQPPAEPTAELRNLYDELNDTILATRDGLRERLGEKEFEDFEKSVDENIAAHIKSKPFDASDPKLSRSREPVRFPRLNAIPPEAVPSGSMLMVRRDPPQTKNPAPTVDQRSSKRAKESRLAIPNEPDVCLV